MESNTDSASTRIENDIEYAKVGDISLKLDVYFPQDVPRGPVPVVMYIHGGAWRQGGKKAGKARSMCRLLAERGFFAVGISYRLSGVAIFPAAVEDCKAAIAWIRTHAKEYQMDPHRIGVVGRSAGGHLALMMGLTDASAGLEGPNVPAGISTRVQAVVAHCGPAVFTAKETFTPDSPIYQFLGGTQQEKPENYQRASPLNHASQDAPPILLIHGDKDTTVGHFHSEKMFEHLQKTHVESELITVKDGNHPLDNEVMIPSPAEVMKLTVDFFDRHLKKTPKPLSPVL